MHFFSMPADKVNGTLGNMGKGDMTSRVYLSEVTVWCASGDVAEDRRLESGHSHSRAARA
jgi:hypothetical protein